MFYRRLLLVLLATTGIACKKKVEQPKPRYAVVRFENLSGDPALDWVGRAASEMFPAMLADALDGPVLHSYAVGRQAAALGGRPAGSPGISAERSQALLAGASRIVTGYVEVHNGQVRITVNDQELSTGKRFRTATATGAEPVAAIAAAAHALSPAAHEYFTRDTEVVRHYAKALEAAPAESTEELRAALARDPDFGPGWTALARTRAAAGDRDGAEQAIMEGRGHHLDAFTAASLDLEIAELKGDRQASLVAERRLSVLSPGDTVLLRGLAEREMALGQFREAANDWKRLGDLLLNDAMPWNSLAYARAYAKDYAGAREALDIYRKWRPDDPNLEDSGGDLEFLFGHFKEAAAHYTAAYGKNNNFLRGGDLYKAAWALFRAGDRAGSDAQFARFRDIRTKASDPLLPLIEADWLYRTGRTAEGIARLGNSAPGMSTASAQVRQTAAAQLAVWAFIAGEREKAIQAVAAAGPPTTAPIAMLNLATAPPASAAEWKSRIERALPGPGVAALRTTTLAYVLLLNGLRQDALPVWEQVANEAPGTDFFSRSVLAQLQGKPPAIPLIPDANTVNPFGILAEKLPR